MRLTDSVIAAVHGAVKQLLPEQEREDAAQDTFLKLLERSERPGDMPEALAVTTAKNVCRDWYRRKRVHDTSVSEWPDEDSHIIDVCDTETPLDVLLAVETAQERLQAQEQDMRLRRYSDEQIGKVLANKLGR